MRYRPTEQRPGSCIDSLLLQIGSLKWLLDNNSTPSTWLFASQALDNQLLCRNLYPRQSAYLIDTFRSNVDPFVRVLHKPTMLKQVNHFQRGIIGVEFETQLSAIYNLAVLSLTEDDCVQNLGQSRENLLQHFKADVEHGLRKIDLTTTHQLMALQTLLLHLVSMNCSIS